MEHGVHPVRPKKHWPSTRTFGASVVDYTPFSLDAGFGFPDQNRDGHPNGCRVYTTLALCQDQDKAQYDRDALAVSVASIEGLPTYSAGNVEDALKAASVPGVSRVGDPTEHPRGHYFMLEQQPGMDWFDSAIAVMRKTGSTLSVASPWFPEFEAPGPAGIQAPGFPLRWQDGVPGHNHQITGLSVVAGQPLLDDKSWQGPEFGAGGLCRWTRESFNELMSIPGAGAFLVAPWDGSITTIQYGIIYRLEILIRLYSRILQRSVVGAVNSYRIWRSTAVYSPF